MHPHSMNTTSQQSTSNQNKPNKNEVHTVAKCCHTILCNLHKINQNDATNGREREKKKGHITSHFENG